jgi:hypothetical protein
MFFKEKKKMITGEFTKLEELVRLILCEYD